MTNKRDSPRLRFSKEELENPKLARKVEKAEQAAEHYDHARKKLQTHRLKLTVQEVQQEQKTLRQNEVGTPAVLEPDLSASTLETKGQQALDTVDKSIVLWYNEEKRTGVFLHGEQLSTARYVRCDVGNSQAVHNRKQGNVGRERKGYPSISEWRVLDFENGSTMERPAAGIW